MNITSTRPSLAIFAALALCALVGCAPEPTPTASPTVPGPTSPAVTETTAPTPTTTPGPFAIPDCEELVPLEDVQAAAGADVTLLDADWTPYDVVPGTAAEAADFTAQHQVCVWGTDDEPVVSVVVAELPASDQNVLLTEISGTIYFEDQLDGADAFSRDLETDGPSSATHLLIGDAWIVVTGELTVEDSRSLAVTVLGSVRAANPGLG